MSRLSLFLQRALYVILGVGLPLGLLVWVGQQWLGVRFDYTLQIVALGGALLGVISGVVGTFAVLRQQSLIGDSLSHAALPGVGFAFLLFGKEMGWLLLGAGVAGWLGVWLVNAIANSTRLKQDTALTVILTTFFAAGIGLMVYIQQRPDASQAGLDHFIFGQAAAMLRSDVLMIASLGVGVFVVLGLFWKEFKLITFDTEFARANGYPVRFLELLLSTLIVIATVMGLQVAGVILMVGMLIAPSVAARQWTNDLGMTVVLAGIFGGVSGALGAYISGVGAQLATGPLIIVAAFVIVVISLLFAPQRGIVWMQRQRIRNNRRFAAQAVLQDIYVYAQSHHCDDAPEAILLGARGAVARVGLRQLAGKGYIVAHTGRWQLTPEGKRAAQSYRDNQRLWELYRQYGEELGLPALMPDPQRSIQELLPQEALHLLEQKQNRLGGAA